MRSQGCLYLLETLPLEYHFKKNKPPAGGAGIGVASTKSNPNNEQQGRIGTTVAKAPHRHGELPADQLKKCTIRFSFIMVRNPCFIH